MWWSTNEERTELRCMSRLANSFASVKLDASKDIQISLESPANLRQGPPVIDANTLGGAYFQYDLPVTLATPYVVDKGCNVYHHGIRDSGLRSSIPGAMVASKIGLWIPQLASGRPARHQTPSDSREPNLRRRLLDPIDGQNGFNVARYSIGLAELLGLDSGREKHGRFRRARRVLHESMIPYLTLSLS